MNINIVNEETKKYLQNNTYLNNILKIIINKINEYFDYTNLYLEYFDDQLLLLIATNYTPKQALEKLWIFDKDWWIDNKNDKICIDIIPK